MRQLISEKVKELGLEFPPAPMPIGLYRPLLVIGKFLYVSGQGPVQMDGSLMVGRAGDDLTKEQAKLAARQVGLTMLSTIQTHFPISKHLKHCFFNPPKYSNSPGTI